MRSLFPELSFHVKEHVSKALFQMLLFGMKTSPIISKVNLLISLKINGPKCMSFVSLFKIHRQLIKVNNGVRCCYAEKKSERIEERWDLRSSGNLWGPLFKTDFRL